MGRSEILDKLAAAFQRVPASEETLIFLLSKVRKILELEQRESDYQKLHFYCNFALHSELNRRLPPQVLSSLGNVIEGKEYTNSIINFADFHSELERFIKEYSLPNFYLHSTDEERVRLYDLLLQIYSDTPVTIHGEKKYRMNIQRVGYRSSILSFIPLD